MRIRFGVAQEIDNFQTTPTNDRCWVCWSSSQWSSLFSGPRMELIFSEWNGKMMAAPPALTSYESRQRQRRPKRVPPPITINSDDWVCWSWKTDSSCCCCCWCHGMCIGTYIYGHFQFNNIQLNVFEDGKIVPKISEVTWAEWFFHSLDTE